MRRYDVDNLADLQGLGLFCKGVDELAADLARSARDEACA